MPKKFTTSELEEYGQHYHNWYPRPDGTEYYCANGYKGGKCKALKVTNSEHDHRMAAWSSYYKLCQTTEAYKDYQAMKKLFAVRDITAIKELSKKIRSECDVVINRYGEEVLELKPGSGLPRPNFPDPYDPNFPYVVEGI